MKFEWIHLKVVHREIYSEVSKVIVHPKYAMSMMIPHIFDVALLKLANPIRTSNVFVCLPNNDLDQFVGAIATASGWGLTSAISNETSKVNNNV